MKCDLDPYPFHATVKPLPPMGNYYGCDPYNTTDAPRMRQRVRQVERSLVETRPAMRPVDPWAVIGRLLAGGRHNG